MAELERKEDHLILHLSPIEKAEAVHGDLHVPVSKVRSVEVIHDAQEWTRVKTGFKVGMRVPGVATVAVVRSPDHKAFIAVHHDTPRAVHVTLEGDPYDEWVVGVQDPESVIAGLNIGN
jgi:hypothetical protein